MVRISKRERKLINRQFKRVYTTRTRHTFYVEERYDVIYFLRGYRRKH